MKIALVYEISSNPYFSTTAKQHDDRLSEFIQPSEINKITRAFKTMGHQVEVIDGPLELISEAERLKKENSIVFNKSIGFKGLERKIHIPAICMLFEIPLVGSSAYGMTLAKHKYHTIKLLKGMGIRVPESTIIYPEDPLKYNNFKFPVIVKPNHESDALGISDNSIFHNKKGLASAVKKLHHDFKQPVVIEEYIPGEEWKVPVIGNKPNSLAVGCSGTLKNGLIMNGTLQTRKDVIEDRLEYYLPKNKKMVKTAQKIAQMVHEQFELRDYSRTDFRINSQNELVCMEVATHPDISEDSSFIYGAIQSYSSYIEVMEALLNAAIERYRTTI